jgi:hypothetical protein
MTTYIVTLKSDKSGNKAVNADRYAEDDRWIIFEDERGEVARYASDQVASVQRRDATPGPAIA